MGDSVCALLADRFGFVIDLPSCVVGHTAV